jgi:hypothetical protein
MTWRETRVTLLRTLPSPALLMPSRLDSRGRGCTYTRIRVPLSSNFTLPTKFLAGESTCCPRLNKNKDHILDENTIRRPASQIAQCKGRERWARWVLQELCEMAEIAFGAKSRVAPGLWMSTHFVVFLSTKSPFTTFFMVATLEKKRTNRALVH